jgi:hypothetical protein
MAVGDLQAGGLRFDSRIFTQDPGKVLSFAWEGASVMSVLQLSTAMGSSKDPSPNWLPRNLSASVVDAEGRVETENRARQ